MESINYQYHIYTGYLLAPLRLISFLTISIITFLLLFIIDYLPEKFKKQSIYYVVNKFYINCIIYICGLKINIDGKENITDNPVIIIGNHIHLYDPIIVTHIYDKFLSYLTYEKYNIFPISCAFKASDTILCNINKKNGTIEKIKEHLKNKKQLVIFPDRCDIIKENKLIAPFKNGAFIPKEPIQPLVIRYVPSSNLNLNWSEESLLKHLFKSILDGQIEIHVKVLPIQYYKEEYKSFENYRDNIYNLMCKELQTLPKQYPPRLSIGDISSKYTMKYLLFIPYTLAIFNYILGIYSESIKHLFLFISGYFNNFYPTKNTNLMNKATILYLIYDTFYCNELNIYDYNIQRLYLYLIIIYGIIFYTHKIKYEILFEEKNCILPLIPGYITSLFINIFYLFKIMYDKC